MRTSLLSSAFALGIAAGSGFACRADFECTAGSRSCACTEEQTCLEGLDCIDGTCVELGDETGGQTSDETAGDGDSTAGDGDGSTGDGDGTSGDGTTGDGDGTSGDGDGDGTSGDGDGTSGDGDGTTGDGDGTTGDGDGTTGDGDGTTGDGDGTSGDGDGTSGDGTTGDGDGTSGDGTTGDGDGDGTTGDGDGVPGCPHSPVAGDPAVDITLVATGFDNPLFVAGHPTQPDRLFVVEQGGSIKILEPGATMAPASDFLSLAVNDGPNEMGLLGFAFHPDFPTDPRVYVNYNPTSVQRTRVSEFTLDPGDPDIADPLSERILLDFDQPYSNHNGGMLAFGPDGMLYIGVGDGGSANDPLDAGQDLTTILGKVLRIDVEGSPYTVPNDNPFLSTPGAAPEVWAYGLRNPWRFAFDGPTLYLADVGQNSWEEVDVIVGGGNYGWSDMEGAHCFNDPGCDLGDTSPNAVNSDGLTMPIYEYSHAIGASITGGYVYRSCEVPAWQGRYFFADYVDNQLFSLEWDGVAVSNAGVIGTLPAPVSSFGTNAWGDVFVTTFGAAANGRVYRLTP